MSDNPGDVDFDALCPVCAQPIGGHSYREYIEHTSTRLDYEDLPDGPTVLGQVQDTLGDPCGRVTMSAAVIDLDEQGRLPGFPDVVPVIGFTFHRFDGAHVRAALVLSDTAMRELKTLCADTIDGAVRAAATTRAKKRGAT